MLETEIEAPPESVFAIAVKRCPPRASSRAILELLDHFMPDQQPDESLRQESGELLPAAAAYTSIRVLKDLLGPIHPAVSEMAHDLREEFRQ